MLTMPVAGTLTDKIGPGKIVLAGIVVIVVGMLGFTQVGVGVTEVAVSQSGVTTTFRRTRGCWARCSSWASAWARR